MLSVEDLKNKIILDDCLNVLKQLPDKCVDLCLSDPPYGISYARGKNGWGECDNRPDLKDVAWDKFAITKEYVDEMIRISKVQIIFGGNYITDLLPVSKCWLVWDKCNGTTNKSVFADVELVWTSLTKVCKMYSFRQMGFIKDTKDKRVHPTQKPSELFRMILNDYSDEGMTILDPFAGSGTTAIACHDLKRNFICIEKEPAYVEISRKRLEVAQMQLNLF